MIPEVPRGARLGTGGLAAFTQASRLFQPTNMRRIDSRVWRPSQADELERQDAQVFSPVGDRADAGLWDVGENAPGRGVPQALQDNSAGELGLTAQEQADELMRRRAPVGRRGF